MGYVLAVICFVIILVWIFNLMRQGIGGGSSKCAACGKALGRVGMQYAKICHHCGHRQGEKV